MASRSSTADTPTNRRRATKSEVANLSTTLTRQCREALTIFCRRRGLKINHFLEQIIWDRLEDEMDAEVASRDEDKPLVDLDQLRDR